MGQVFGAWWTYALLWAFAMFLYASGQFRRKLKIKKLLQRHDEECKSCSQDNLNDCNLQLSMVFPRSDLNMFDRIQGLLQSCLNDNFHSMMGEMQDLDETFSVISYSLAGEGSENGLSMFNDMDHIVSQENIPYHIIAVKRLGNNANPYAYATLNEVNKLGRFE